jgi:hypothetical protein
MERDCGQQQGRAHCHSKRYRSLQKITGIDITKIPYIRIKILSFLIQNKCSGSTADRHPAPKNPSSLRTITLPRKDPAFTVEDPDSKTVARLRKKPSRQRDPTLPINLRDGQQNLGINPTNPPNNRKRIKKISLAISKYKSTAQQLKILTQNFRCQLSTYLSRL